MHARILMAGKGNKFGKFANGKSVLYEFYSGGVGLIHDQFYIVRTIRKKSG